VRSSPSEDRSASLPGAKVGDEYAVRLCREHHRDLHRRGNEANCWTKQGIAPLPVAAEPVGDDAWGLGRRSKDRLQRGSIEQHRRRTQRGRQRLFGARALKETSESLRLGTGPITEEGKRRSRQLKNQCGWPNTFTCNAPGAPGPGVGEAIGELGSDQRPSGIAVWAVGPSLMRREEAISVLSAERHLPE